MSKSERVLLSCYDRVAIGGELLLFDHPGERPAGAAAESEDGAVAVPVAPTAEFAVEELQAGLRNKGKQAQEVGDKGRNVKGDTGIRESKSLRLPVSQ